MKNKLVFVVLAMVVLAIGIAAVGCVSAPKETSVVLESNGPPITPKLDELLHKYAGPRCSQNTDGKITYYYYLDPLRFEAFKTELDAGSEYQQTGIYPEDRDKERGMTLARWVVRSSGSIQLELFTEDDSGFSYDYKKVPQASGLKLDEFLHKYAGPYPQRWDGEGKGLTYVYFLDSLHFEEFKTELDAGGEYQQTGSWTKKRDSDKGVSFAQWAVRPKGEFVLRLSNADNSVIEYHYKKFVKR
jgi:hypothetical protein